MKAIYVLLTVLVIPLMILNILGGLVSGIWLAILGEWGKIGWGLFGYVVSTFAISLALLPSWLFVAPAGYFAEKRNAVGFFFFGVLGGAYTVVVIAAWCSAVLFFFARDVTSDAAIPVLVWSYSVAIGPLAYMAQKERDEGGASTTTTFLAGLAYAVVVAMMFFSSITGIQAIKTFIGFMSFGLIINLVSAYFLLRGMRDR